MVIGNLHFKTNVFLAPMAGVCDLSFRKICRRFGVELTYSEMVSAKALTFGDEKTKKLLYHEDESPFAVQIFGHEPSAISYAAEYATTYGCSLIDLNFGCPAPKIVRNQDGSALLRQPALCGQVAKAAIGATSLPVTAKIRLGWEENNAVEVAKVLEDSGIAAICVHGRTREQQYSGEADWDAIAEVKRAVSIPVIANGDVRSRKDYVSILERTGCDAVMIGRGALGNPWIFEEILSGEREVTLSERLSVARDHLELLLLHKGTHIGVLEARKHLCWYLKKLPSACGWKRKINTAATPAQLLAILEELEVLG